MHEMSGVEEAREHERKGQDAAESEVCIYLTNTCVSLQGGRCVILLCVPGTTYS